MIVSCGMLRLAAASIAASIVLSADPCLAADGGQPFDLKPPGIECRRDFLTIESHAVDEFVVNGSAMARKDLRKALRSARKAAPFDCVRITGGNPSADEVRKLIVDLSSMKIYHVEWVGTRPITKP